MSRQYTAIMSCAAVIGLLPLMGCANNFAAQWPVTARAPAGDALITFKDSTLSNAPAKRVWYTGAFEHLEYAQLETNNLVVEAVYDTKIGDQSILDYPYRMESMLDTWNHNNGQAKILEKSKPVQAWHGIITYQLYRLQKTGQQCAGFNSEWDHSGSDPNGRPKKVFFGYMCAKNGQSLSRDLVQSVLKGVKLDDRFGHTFVKPGQKASTDEAAFSLASGTGRAGTGNNKFPFEFGTQYSTRGS